MAKSLLKGGLLGGLILFAWSAVSWTALPWHEGALHKFTDEDAVVQAIKANAPDSGVYLYPGADAGASAEERKAAEEKMKQGPMLFVAYTAGPAKSMAAAMSTQVLTMIAVSLLVTWLVLQTRGLSFWGRVRFVVVAAFTAGIFGRLPEWNWMGFSTEYVAVDLVDFVVGGFLSALVIAWATKPAAFTA